MGQGWRRVSESVRQKVIGFEDKNFKPTSNKRNEAMFIECTDFAAHLKTLERDLRALQKQVEGGFRNMRDILNSPIPRVYEEGENGVAVPADSERPTIGQDVQVELIVNAGRDMKEHMEEQVINPMEQWMVAYRTIQIRMRELEALRLEVDSRRRTVSSLQGKVQRLQSNLGTTLAKGQAELERTQEEMDHKDTKLQSTTSLYKKQEQTVYDSLSTLAKDTAVLRDYAGQSMLVVQPGYSTTGDAAFNGYAPDDAYPEQAPRESKAGAAAQAAAPPKQSFFGKMIKMGSGKLAKHEQSVAPPGEQKDEEAYDQAPPSSKHTAQALPESQEDNGNPYREAFGGTPTGRYTEPSAQSAWDGREGY
ncbi:MAG: hypothetical protein WDW36_009206 [Sanguina aurantia]